MFCWHRWARWEDFNIKRARLLNPKHPLEYRVNVEDIVVTETIPCQKRQCEKCGKRQVRYI